jgi:hypothetical protein
MDFKVSKHQYWLVICGVCVAMAMQRVASAFFSLDKFQMTSLILTLAPLLVFSVGVGKIAFINGQRAGVAEANAMAEDSWKLDKEMRSARAAAFPTTSAPGSTPLTEPDGSGRGASMALALQVQERYWHPDRFIPADPDTVPKQKDIVDWIKEAKPGISDALARSIEKVACPIDR